MKKRIIPILLILCLVLFQVPTSILPINNNYKNYSKSITTSFNDDGYVKALNQSDTSISNHKGGKSNRFTKVKQSKKTVSKSLKGDIDDSEWNIQVINAQNVSQISNGVNKIKVAIIDSGIDYTEDIDVVERKNFVPGQDEISIIYEDLTGHGTAVAGILAAKDNDDEISGINSNVEIYSARVLDETNTAPISRVVDAIHWAIEKNVNIISISFGTNTNSEALKSAIQDAYNAGILIIAAAGNGGSIEYPAAYDEVVAVGSVDNNGQHSQSSSTGEALELVAPGELIKSTGAFGGVIITSGTSIAVPHVVGVASILWEKDLSVPSNFIRYLMDYSANLYGDSSSYGYGLIDLNYALNIYDEFKNIYDQSTNINELYHKIETNTNLSPNTTPITVFTDVDYVEGSWYVHPELVDHGTSNTPNSLTSEAINIIKKGCVYQDYGSSGLSGMFSNPLWHGYWCQKDSSGNYIYSSNYMAGFIYITRLALKGGDNTGVGFPATADSRDATAMVGKITTSNINGVSWTSTQILGSTYTNNATNRGYFLWGMAIHIITDSYAHNAYYYDSSTSSWVQISHELGADEVSMKPARYSCAKAAAVNVINDIYTKQAGGTDDYSDFMTYNGTFYIRNLVRYADIIDTSSTYTYNIRPTLLLGDYANNGGN